MLAGPGGRSRGGVCERAADRVPAGSREVHVVQQQIKILIIEDDDDQRELMRETLEDHFGVGTVVGAESGNAAMAHDLARFDLILSDYNLPDRTGMNLLEEIKSRCTTPVIMVT